MSRMLWVWFAFLCRFLVFKIFVIIFNILHFSVILKYVCFYLLCLEFGMIFKLRTHVINFGKYSEIISLIKLPSLIPQVLSPGIPVSYILGCYPSVSLVNFPLIFSFLFSMLPHALVRTFFHFAIILLRWV